MKNRNVIITLNLKNGGIKMKKIVTIISMLAILFTMVLANTVKATSSAELPDKLYAMGSKYGVSASDKVKLERFLEDNPVTDEQADQLVAKAEEAVKVMENAGVTDVNKLTKEEKASLQNIAKEAASIVGVNLVFKSGAVEIYKNGKLIETITSGNNKLSYTGNSINAVAIVSFVAIIALAIGVFAKRRAANA